MPNNVKIKIKFHHKTPWPWSPPAGQSSLASSGKSSSPESPSAVHDQLSLFTETISCLLRLFFALADEMICSSIFYCVLGMLRNTDGRLK